MTRFHNLKTSVEIRRLLEPAVTAPEGTEEEVLPADGVVGFALLSIAISLKRLADQGDRQYPLVWGDRQELWLVDPTNGNIRRAP